MKEVTKNKIKGVAIEVAGEVKQVLGKALDRPDIAQQGKQARNAGRRKRQADNTTQPRLDP